MKNIIALSFVALFISGCFPYVREIHTAPAVDGQLLNADNHPLQNVTVRYSSLYNKEETCREYSNEAVTDKNGKFQFEGTSETSYILVALPVHYSRTWKLCFSYPDGTEKKWKGSSYGPESAPELVHLTCGPEKELRKNTYSGPTPYRSEAFCEHLNINAAIQ
jgi:hypothetical protein